MFKKIKKHEIKQNDNKNMEIFDYFLNLDNPSVKRQEDIYYVEMQQLSFNLVRYLKMKTKQNVYQGNWNFTYLIENMSKEDYKFIARKFLGRMTASEWKEVIESSPFRDTKYNLLELVEDNIENYSIYEIKFKPKLKDVQITYVEKPDLYKALAELENKFELEKIEYKLFS